MSLNMKFLGLIILLSGLHSVFGNELMLAREVEREKMQVLINIIKSGRERNDWNNILCVGKFPDSFYKVIQEIPSTFVISESGKKDHKINDVVPYASYTVLLSCADFEHFENLLKKTITSPYWHPLSNVILIYQSTPTKQLLAKLFFIFWYYKAINSIIIMADDTKESFLISYYNPYISENYKLPNLFGCWTARSIMIPVTDFKEEFICVDGCHNVTQKISLRKNKLGTCLGFDTKEIQYNSSATTQPLALFEDKLKNLHGFKLKAYATEAKPFMMIDLYDNGSWSFHARDGMIWNVVSERLNFTIDLSLSLNEIKQAFNFELTVRRIFDFSHRKADLSLMPVYQMELVIVAVDYAFPYKESGLCILAPRASFETALFDVKRLKENYQLVIEFVLCLICIWFVFFIFNVVEKGTISLDQIGKDLVNVFRNVLSISLYKAPKRRSFRIFLGTSIWCFFVLNFFTQAAIISFFSSFKRGQEVDTFDDVIEKGYIIEGMASPDAVLPDDEEKFRLMNSKLVSTQDFYECPKRMINDSRRFCLIDCAVGHYLERNKLNDMGEQYMHLVERDRVHSHYLNMVFPKNSAMTKQFNKILRSLFEAGIIKKWEDYRYSDIKDEAHVKSLGMNDLLGIFKCYFLLLGLCVSIFLIEITPGCVCAIHSIGRSFRLNFLKWNRTRLVKKKIQLEIKMGKIKHIDSTTQA